MEIGKALVIRCGFRAGPDGVVPVQLTCWWIATLDTIEEPHRPEDGSVRLILRPAPAASSDAEAHAKKEIA